MFSPETVPELKLRAILVESSAEEDYPDDGEYVGKDDEENRYEYHRLREGHRVRVDSVVYKCITTLHKVAVGH